MVSRILRLALLFAFYSCSPAYADTLMENPPTTSMGSNDTGNIPTFNFQFPSCTITHTGPTAVINCSGGGGGGNVIAVTASSPLASSGGANPNISISQAGVSSDGYLAQGDWNTFNGKQAVLSFNSPLTEVGTVIGVQQSSTSQAGYLSAADWNTFNNKQPAGSYVLQTTSITTAAPLAGGGALSSSLTLSIPQAATSTDGYLSHTDWNTFSGKQAALTPGNISTATSGITIGSGSVSTVGPNVTVDVQTASGTQPGLISSTDWLTFNGKQVAGNYLTALTGDVIASGPGSASSTIQAGVVTNAKLANMAAYSFKGNNQSTPQPPVDLTESQVTAMLFPFAGDSGLGGTQGLVPAPPAGSGEQNLLLSAAGSFTSVDQQALRINPFELVSQTPGVSGSTKYQSVSIMQNGQNTYALVAGGGTAATLSVFNITDQAAPVLRGTIVLAGSYGVCPGVWPYVYVPSSGGSTLYVVSIANPNSPTQVGSLAITGTPGSLYNCAYSGGGLYLATQNKGLTVLDVGGLSSGGTATTPVQTYQEGGTTNKSFGVAIQGNYVYTTNYQTSSPYTIRQVKSWLLTSPGTPAVPSLVQSFQITTAGEALGLEISGNTAYVTVSATGVNAIDLVDITNPAVMANLSVFTPSGSFNSAVVPAIAATTFSADNYILVPSGTISGLGGAIDYVDVSNRSAPILIDTIYTNVSNSVFGGIIIDPRKGWIWAADYGVAPGSSGSLDLFSDPLDTATAGALNVGAINAVSGITGIVNYTPATPSNWTTVPTNVQSGLDTLAAAVAAIVGGSTIVATRVVTTSTTILSTDRFVLANCSSPCTVTLTSAATSGQVYTVKSIGSAQVTVARAGSDLIDGQTSVIIAKQYSASSLVSANGGWSQW